ncbi:uncharacterized protein [Macrobrachium rosenbergii]|uniref:uncharacterized protein n=1 Tax=Macrobrachium rosenbergii TaxID=79674 RepID=UPI0034D56EB0
MATEEPRGPEPVGFYVRDTVSGRMIYAFLSELWSALAQLLGTDHHTTPAYNPTANGLVERFHRSLKVSLMARCTAEEWKYQLPWVLLGLRTAPRADGALSAAKKTYGKPLVVPGELVTEDRHNPSVQRLRDVVGKFTPCKRTYTDRLATFTPPSLSSSTHVFVRDDAVHPPLTRPYRGPFRVLEQQGVLARPLQEERLGVGRPRQAPPSWRRTQTSPHRSLHLDSRRCSRPPIKPINNVIRGEMIKD